MINCSIDRELPKALYSQIYDSIRDMIASGEIEKDTKLPSKRILASFLGVSVLTVQTAYEQLLAEGYIRSAEKRGYYACDAETGPLRQLSGAGPKQEELIPAKVSDEDFPMASWLGVMRKLMSSGVSAGSAGHTGRAELRNALSKYLYNFRGMTADPSCIVVGAGSEYLYDILVKLLGRDKLYALEDPGYDRVRSIIELGGGKTVSVPVDSEGLVTSELAKTEADIVHVTPAHHFPTGVVMPASRRAQLIRWAREKDAYIIEDDYDSEFRQRPIPPLFSMDKDERVIYINTFSNTLSKSVRISYMVLPKKLMEKYRSMFSFYTCTVASLEQLTLADFMEDGYFERHLNRLRKKYAKRRAELKAIAVETGMEIYDSGSGLHFLLSIPEGAEEICRDRKLHTVSDYSVEKNRLWDKKAPLLVVNLTEFEPESFREFLESLKKALS